jgi:predicted negative regulator of RcsB-dependent stress response
MKRQLKKQLKEDEFVSGFGKIMHFMKIWEREFIIAGAAALAVVLLFLGFQFLRSQQNAKDSRAAGEILDLRADLVKTPQNAVKLEQIAAKGGKYARLASMSLATYWIEQGQLDKAQAVLSGVKENPKDFVYFQTQDLAAQTAILKGEYDKAVVILKKIEDAKPKDYLLDAVLFHKAEALEKKGSVAEALVVYKKLQDEYAQTYYGYDASLKVKKLETTK